MHSHLAVMVGEYIYEERYQQRMNQNELAHELGMSPQFLGRIERGEVMIPESSLVKCIKILGLVNQTILDIYQVAGEKKAKDILKKVGKKSGRKLIKEGPGKKAKAVGL